MFKISTAKGDWDAFNAGAYGCKYGKEPGKAVEFEAGYTEKHRMPLARRLQNRSIRRPEDHHPHHRHTPNPNPGGPTKVYLRGEMNGWGAPAEWE